MINVLKNLVIGNVLFLGFVYGIFHFNHNNMNTADFITFSFLISVLILGYAIIIGIFKKLKKSKERTSITKVKINRKKD